MCNRDLPRGKFASMDQTELSVQQCRQPMWTERYYLLHWSLQWIVDILMVHVRVPCICKRNWNIHSKTLAPLFKDSLCMKDTLQSHLAFSILRKTEPVLKGHLSTFKSLQCLLNTGFTAFDFAVLLLIFLSSSQRFCTNASYLPTTFQL